MRLDGRRESSNVEDRRGMSGGAKAGIGGIGAIVIAALFAWMSGVQKQVLAVSEP